MLLLIAAGCSNSEIAKRLFISPKTVSIYVSLILAEMGVSSQTGTGSDNDQEFPDRSSGESGCPRPRVLANEA